MKSETYTEQVLDDFIHGNSTLADVEKLLKEKSETRISEIIAVHKAATVAIQRNAVITQVNKVHEQFVASLPKETVITDASSLKAKIKKMSPLAWMARAAAVFIVVTCSWYAYQVKSASSSELYVEMYQSYNVNNDRAGIDEIATHGMIQQYKDKNYAAVINTYQSLEVTTSREKFLTAMSYQEEGNYEKAMGLLKNILQENQQKETRLYNDEAEFYISLNYLQLNKGELAFPLLQKIYKTPGHTFHERVGKWTITRLKWII